MMSEYISLNQVKSWIVEHACKHHLLTVLREILKCNPHLIPSENEDETKPESEFLKLISIACCGDMTPTMPTFLFIFLTRLITESLNCELKNKSILYDKQFKWLLQRPKVFHLLSELLEHAYKQYIFVPFGKYIEFDIRLKLLEFLMMISKGESNEFIIERLNLVFPRDDKTLEITFRSLYPRNDSELLKKYILTYNASRTHILQLLLGTERKLYYLDNDYAKDIKSFVSAIKQYFNAILRTLLPKLPPSAIETIIQGAHSDLEHSLDPAIQLFLAHLHSNMTEDDFVEIVKTLNVESELPSLSSKLERFCSSSYNDSENSNQDNYFSQNSINSVIKLSDPEEVILTKTRVKSFKTKDPGSLSNSKKTEKERKTCVVNLKLSHKILEAKKRYSIYN